MPTQLDAGVFAERTYLKGLCHLADGTWVHLSARKGGRKVRRIEPGMPESESAELEGGTYYAIGEISAFLPELGVATIAVDDFERWSAIPPLLELRLAEPDPDPSAVSCAPIGQGSSDRLVPITGLRRFYEVLRAFSPVEIHEALARYAAGTKGATFLRDLFVDATDHLASRYVGVNDTLRIERRSDPASDASALASTGKFAQELVAHVRSLGVVPLPGGPLHYVWREVGPLRTPNGRWEDGRSARNSGAGGIDVLLATADPVNPLVVVGEVKAATDTNLFLALVQALTYASELVGCAAQRRRLASSWREKLGHLETAEGPWAEVVVFHEPSPKEDAFLPLVARLAEALVADRDEGVGRWIRSIRFVKTRRTDDGFAFGD